MPGSESLPAQRVMVASRRRRVRETVVVRDTLPPLRDGEIRLSVDAVGLTANNRFYAQMGNAPVFRFFSVYPIASDPSLVNVPAWGVGTVVATRNAEFEVGERFRGFLHMTNVAQMGARRTSSGFVARGGNRRELVPAYNSFHRLSASPDSAFASPGERADLALIAAPGALSGHAVAELLRMERLYGGDGVALTSASSKLSLAVALSLQPERADGTLRSLVGLTSPGNLEFVRRTELFDDVRAYDGAPLHTAGGRRFVLVDVAGDAAVYRRNESALVKTLAVGGTHSRAARSTFTAFGPAGLLELTAMMMAPAPLAKQLGARLKPRLSMFFAPAVLAELSLRHGQAEALERAERALAEFVDRALAEDWIRVNRASDLQTARTAFERVFAGEVPPSEAVVVSLVDEVV